MFVIKLKEFLKEKGISQAELVRLTGLSKSGVSQYLSGKTIPSKKAILKIAAALNISPDKLTESTPRKITVQQVAELMGIDAQSLRIGLQQDKIPFGTAWKAEGSTKYTYIIYPKKFTEYTGIKI